MMCACPKCGVEKPRTAEFFERDRRMSDGLTSACRACRRIVKTISRKLHNDARNARRKGQKRSVNKSPYYFLARRTGVRLSKYKHLGHGLSGKDVLGCTYAEFFRYIEAQFAPGMSWADQRLWHLDHKRPLSSFDLTDEDQFRAAFHHTNVQPLWAADNLSKGVRLAA